MFINIISVSKQQNTITSQLKYACVHLQLARGVWNLIEEREELVNRVTENRKFMKEFEHVFLNTAWDEGNGWINDIKPLNASAQS